MHKETTLLDRITIEPKTTATACVIWLHGLGDSGAGFAPVVPLLNLPHGHAIRFVFPHAPEQAVTINNGFKMPAWYDIRNDDLHNRADMDGVIQSEALVRALIQEQIDNGILASNIVIAGFSQGGVMSLFTGLRFEQTLAGIMALSCYLPIKDQLPAQLSAANKNTPILQHHGELDDVVLMSAGKMANELMETEGYNTQWKTYLMAHSVLPQQLGDIGTWLTECLIK
ncbi:MAG: carboxylesterase [Colwellia sp.]|nr:carboxylesterase [Colwellia sp.]NQY88753.1 carboxylesterase [Colwellia sp.]